MFVAALLFLFAIELNRRDQGIGTRWENPAGSVLFFYDVMGCKRVLRYILREVDEVMKAGGRWGSLSMSKTGSYRRWWHVR
jgi:hypothetical protein